MHTFFIVTEATGIVDDTFEAIEGNLQGDSCLLLVFNPNTNIGYAARSQKAKRWKKFCLNSLTAPNVREKKNIIPGQVDYEWVKERVEIWCEPIRTEDISERENDFEFEGQWYRPSDLFRKKVLGQFPKVDEDSLIPLQWIELAQERWKNYHLGNRNYCRLGVDVAGMGRDCSVYCFRYNNYVEKFDKHNSGGRADHMKVAGKAMNVTKNTTGTMIFIDTIGEGAGVYSRCLEVCDEEGLNTKKANIHSCKYSEGSKTKSGKELTDITGQYTFANMRAYLFWCVRDWLNPDNGMNAMLPPGGTFAEEATEIKFSFMGSGRIIIEPKEDIKERLGFSTDEFDALANTFYPVQLVHEDAYDRYEEDLEDELY